MSYPPVRQLGPGVQLEIERRSEGRQARRIALSARRHQELELQRQPLSGTSSQPIVVGRAKAVRVCAAATSIVAAAVIAYFVAASAGAL
jgi:hypothetical protein